MSDTKQDMPDVIYAAQWMDSKCNILRDYSITPASHSTKYISEHKVETIKEDEYLEGYKTGQSDLEHKHKAELQAIRDEVIPAILNEFDWATENEIKAIEYGVDALRDQIKQRIEGE